MVAAFFLISLGWRCQKESANNVSQPGALKNSINSSVSSVSTVVNSIKSTDGYSVITLNDATQKDVEAVTDTVNIALADIAGVYDYNPVQLTMGWNIPFIKFFQKTEENPLCIVRLPQSKMAHPRTMFHILPADSNLVNDYIVTVSDYQYQRILATSALYKLAAGINVAGVDAGNLTIDASATTSAASYLASYNFGNGMIATLKTTDGDTTVSTQTITKEGVVVYEETVQHVKALVTNGDMMGEGRAPMMGDGRGPRGGQGKFPKDGEKMKMPRERNYTLTIGNVTIKRNGGLETTQVYVDGVLQQNATVEIVDRTDDAQGPSVGRTRNVKITFDDGTSATIAELAGNVLGDVETIFSSLRSVYFASNIVDIVAGNIYLAKRIR